MKKNSYLYKMNLFETIIEKILQNEGSYSDSIDGRYTRDGSLTRHGVNYYWNKDVLRTMYGINSIDDMWKLTRSMATELYRTQYWEPCNVDDQDIGLNLAYHLLDHSINDSPLDACKLLQRAMNRTGMVVLAEDGRIGPISRSALSKMIALNPGMKTITREYQLLRLQTYLQEFNKRTLKARNVKTMRRHRDEIISWSNRVFEYIEGD